MFSAFQREACVNKQNPCLYCRCGHCVLELSCCAPRCRRGQIAAVCLDPSPNAASHEPSSRSRSTVPSGSGSKSNVPISSIAPQAPACLRRHTMFFLFADPTFPEAQTQLSLPLSLLFFSLSPTLSPSLSFFFLSHSLSLSSSLSLSLSLSFSGVLGVQGAWRPWRPVSGASRVSGGYGGVWVVVSDLRKVPGINEIIVFFVKIQCLASLPRQPNFSSPAVRFFEGRVSRFAIFLAISRERAPPHQTLRQATRTLLQNTMAARGTCRQLSGSLRSFVLHNARYPLAHRPRFTSRVDAQDRPLPLRSVEGWCFEKDAQSVVNLLGRNVMDHRKRKVQCTRTQAW